MSTRKLVVVGEAPVATLAVAVGVLERGSQNVRVVELSPDRIAEGPLELLGDELASTTDVFAAIGPNALNFARCDLWAKLRLLGYRGAVLVHPRASVDPDVELSDNVLVAPGAVVEPGVRIGRGTIIGSGAVLGAGAVVAPWCWVGRRAVVGGGAKIGSHSVIGSGVCLSDGAEFSGPGEIDVPGTYRGSFAAGTFIASEFPVPGARLVRA